MARIASATPQSVLPLLLAGGILLSLLANLRDGALVRVALSSDAHEVFGSAAGKPLRVDDIVLPLSRGRSIAVRFVADATPSPAQLENVSRFYFRACYALYPLRVYVADNPDHVINRASDLLSSGFDLSDDWCRAREVDLVVTVHLMSDSGQELKYRQVSPAGGI